MSAETRNGRPTAEATGTPVDGQGASPAAPSVESNYPRPLGATPLYPPLSLIPDRDPQDMGDALGLDEALLTLVPSYRYRWFNHLGRGEA